jgi:hypothetical protein
MYVCVCVCIGWFTWSCELTSVPVIGTSTILKSIVFVMSRNQLYLLRHKGAEAKHVPHRPHQPSPETQWTYTEYYGIAVPGLNRY